MLPDGFELTFLRCVKELWRERLRKHGATRALAFDDACIFSLLLHASLLTFGLKSPRTIARTTALIVMPFAFAMLFNIASSDGDSITVSFRFRVTLDTYGKLP